MRKRIIAVILAFVPVFAVGGYAIAKRTGNTTEGGFEFNGALALFGLVIGSFVLCNKWLGGRLGGRLVQRLVGIAGRWAIRPLTCVVIA